MENSSDILDGDYEVSNSLIHIGETTSSVESGWTTYIDDFMQSERKRRETSPTSTTRSTPIDAAKSGFDVGEDPIGDVPENFQKLMFKKGKPMRFDDSLEDTATSPLGSPKVVEVDTKTIEGKDSIKAYVMNKNSALGRKGFCLVPVSVLQSYVNK